MAHLLKHISKIVDLTRGKDRLGAWMLQILFSLVLILLFSASISAQIWNEDFESDTVGSTQGNGASPKWTTTPPPAPDAWEVQQRYSNHEFVGRNLATNGTWESEFIDISSYTAVYVSVAIRDSGALSQGSIDTLSLYYQINDGPEVLWHKESGSFSSSYVTVTAGGLIGDSIQVIVRMRNGSASETYIIDDIEVFEHRTLYSITDGNWNTNGTWSTTRFGGSCGCTPNRNDIVFIQSTHRVDISSDALATNLTVENGGILRWTSGNNELYLENGGKLEVEGSGELNRNGLTGANIHIDDEWQDFQIVNNGTFSISSLQLENFQGNINLSGTGDIDLATSLEITGDGDAFDAEHDNWGPEIRVINDLTGDLNIGGDLGIAGSGSGDLIFTNNGTVDQEGSITGVTTDSRFYNMANATWYYGGSTADADTWLYADYNNSSFFYDRAGNQTIIPPQDAYQT